MSYFGQHSISSIQFSSFIAYLMMPVKVQLCFLSILLNLWDIFTSHLANWCYLVYAIPTHWLLTLNRSLFWLFVSCLVYYPDTDLFHVSSTCITGFVYGVLAAADFEQVIVLVLLILALFINQTLICSMSAVLAHLSYLVV